MNDLLLGFSDDLGAEGRGEGLLELLGADMAAVALAQLYVAVGIDKGLGLIFCDSFGYGFIATVVPRDDIEVCDWFATYGCW